MPSPIFENSSVEIHFPGLEQTPIPNTQKSSLNKSFITSFNNCKSWLRSLLNRICNAVRSLFSCKNNLPSRRDFNHNCYTLRNPLDPLEAPEPSVDQRAVLKDALDRYAPNIV